MNSELLSALASRRKFVEETADAVEGVGTGAGAMAASRFAGVQFVEKSDTGLTGLINQGARRGLGRGYTLFSPEIVQVPRAT